MNIIYTDDSSFWVHWKDLSNSARYQHPLFSENGLSYYVEYFLKNSDFKDKSFILLENSLPLIGVIMTLVTKDGQNSLSGYGREINYIENCQENLDGLKGARKKFKKIFNKLCHDNNVNLIRFRDYSSINGTISYFGRYLLDKGVKCQTSFLHLIDLSQPVQKIHSQLTKSCRHSVNWGLKNLIIEKKDSSNITREEFDQLRLLHIKESGRETRSIETWDILFLLIKKNKIFMMNGFIEGQLVTSSLFIHNDSCCLYAVSASSRELFDKPLGHAIIWNAILIARQMKCNYFDFGDLVYNNLDEDDSKKQNNINLFKKSFGGFTKLLLTLEWKNNV